MILFPALLLGGHLVTAAFAQVPALNYEPICRDKGGDDLGLKDDAAICMDDEAAARAELAKNWNQFDAADRTSCIRLATTNHTASYVEVLTCLEMDRDAKRLIKRSELGISAPETSEQRERAAAPARSTEATRHPAAPVPLAPSEPAPGPGPLQALCLPGLRDVLPGCQPSAGSR